MVTEECEDAIDVGVVVVEMRRETQHPFPRRTDDTVLFQVAVPLQERALYTRWQGAKDRGADRPRRRAAPSERLEAVGQLRDNANRLGRDRLDSDFQQQLD